MEALKCIDPILELRIWLDFDTISENGRNIYDKRQAFQHYSKLISIEHTRMKQVAWHFEDLEYLNTISNQYLNILSNVTNRHT